MEVMYNLLGDVAEDLCCCAHVGVTVDMGIGLTPDHSHSIQKMS